MTNLPKELCACGHDRSAHRLIGTRLICNVYYPCRCMDFEAITSKKDTRPTPEHGWTCFHCGEHFPCTFAGQQAARHHFGDSPVEQPACTIDARAFREMQDLCARYQSEDTHLHREIARMQADHAVALRREEERGYARGLEDAKKHPETLGLSRAHPECGI